MSAAAPARERLRAELETEGGLIAAELRDHAATGDDAPPVAGPRTAARAEEYALLVAAIREGQLLHHRGAGSVVAPREPDLALLAGDRLFALGLDRLAALGDLTAVAELADVISLCAAAQARGDGELADAAWAAGCAAVAHGPSPELDAAKRAARAGAAGAAAALREAARALGHGDVGHLRPPAR